MVYRRLSFEDDLFTAPVYKRNYRNPRLQYSRKQELNRDPETVTIQEERLQNVAIEIDPMTISPPGALTSISTPSKSVKKMPRDVIKMPTGLIIDYTVINRGSEDLGSSSDPDLYTEFTEACGRGDNDRVQNLLEMIPGVASCIVRSNCYLYPIDDAYLNWRVKVMEKLLQYVESGRDVGWALESTMYCARGWYQIPWPPLHVAAMMKNLSMVQFLLGERAFVRRKSGAGTEAIHLAARVGSIEVLAALIDAGADVNCADCKGRRPLHYISESQDRPDVIEYLAIRGARVDRVHRFTPSLTPSPLDLARKNNLVGNLDSLSILADIEEHLSVQ